MSWATMLLGDAVTLKRGYDLPTSKRKPGEVPIVSSSGVTGRHNESKVEGPGVVTGRYGTLGEVYYIRQDFWPLNTALYVQDFKDNDQRFVAYFLRYILRNTVSDKAAVPGVNRNDLHARGVTLPDKRIQRKTAAILGAYDDLIENNLRRIQLLEQSARLLYKEWFVHLRFPGHEHAKVMNGVPDGWNKRELQDVADITMGQSPKSEYYNEDGIGLPFHQGVSCFGSRFPVNKIYCTAGTRVGSRGDILFSVRAPVGRINIATDTIVLGRGLASIRSKRDQQSFLYYQLKNQFFKEDLMGGGAIFVAITKKDLYGVEVLDPPSPLVQLFLGHVRDIDCQIENLFYSSANLAKARDILLPRLMNGEIPI